MPKLVRFYIRHTIIGFLIAAAFVAALLWFNVANLWHLVTHSDVGLLATFLLVMFHGIVFSGVQFGISIMRLAEKDDDDRGTRSPERAEALVPIPVHRDDRR
ncbi:hypothetical protein P1J78_20195 [Psychromarinibacter sp. C21-152]|uniref:Uncharacterized protein n=1 Tax=Psychromarinibacter sediminicola TaxID=3033385 RepID=A0AAE3NT59_9RHOB|nr:hypothetical protein [Psychromarinibacter sediminicola]MDF0603073.1 hypothetical protein [Psychromarinibacter sediminicola]